MPNTAVNKSVAIVGAGLSAAVCAKALNGLVKKITVFETLPYVGGRLYLSETLSTTPSLTVSTPFFQQIVERWVIDGLVCERNAWHVEISAAEINTLNASEAEYIIKPNAVSLVKHLLNDSSVELNVEVSDIEKRGDQWQLFDFDGGYLGLFDSVIFSAATPAQYDLVRSSDLLSKQFKQIQYSSVWSVVLDLDEDMSVAYDNAIFMGSALSSCFYDDTHSLVLIATPEWSEKYSALPASQAAEKLQSIFCDLTQTNKKDIQSSIAKFWAYKTPINILGEDCLFDETTGLGACGDWCTAARIEGAVLSGFSIADRIMKYFSAKN